MRLPASFMSTLMVAALATLFTAACTSDDSSVGAAGASAAGQTTSVSETTNNTSADSPGNSDNGSANAGQGTGQDNGQGSGQSGGQGGGQDPNDQACPKNPAKCVVEPPPPEPPKSLACAPGSWCVGAANVSIAPSKAHIDGVVEERQPRPVLQRMGIGGYGSPRSPYDAPPTGPGDIQPMALAGVDYLNQFHIGKGFATGTYEEPEEQGKHSIFVRAMYVEEPGKDKLVFLTIDAIGAGNVIQAGIKNAVAKATGVDPKSVLIGSTHSHSAPDLQGLWGGVPQSWLSCVEAQFGKLPGCGPQQEWTNGLYQRAALAAKTAKERAVAADLHTAFEHLNGKNRTRTVAATPKQSADPAMTVLVAVDKGTGGVVGTVVQFSAHPTVLGDSNRKLHTDFVLSLLKRVEAKLGGTAIYYNGTIADTSPAVSTYAVCNQGDALARDYCRVQQYGRSLGDDAVLIAQKAFSQQKLPLALTVAHKESVLPVTNPLFVGAGLLRSFNRYYNFVETPADSIEQIGPYRNELPQLTPTATTVVSRVTIGSGNDRLEMATIPGEGRNALGQLLRGLAWGADANKKPMMILGLTQNTFGYIIPEQEFGEPTNLFKGELLYEETVSLGPLTAPLLRFQSYFPLFNVSQMAYFPGYFSSCTNPQDDACILKVLQHRGGIYQGYLQELPSMRP